MPAFLLTWNPKAAARHDGFAEQKMNTYVIRPFNKNGSVETWWSTFSPKLMQVGDPVFFLKQGPKPKGIFARGEVITDPQRQPRDPRRHRVKVRVTELADVVKNEFLLGEFLSHEVLGKSLMGARMSGRSIPEDKLEALLKVLGPKKSKKKKRI